MIKNNKRFDKTDNREIRGARCNKSQKRAKAGEDIDNNLKREEQLIQKEIRIRKKKIQNNNRIKIR